MYIQKRFLTKLSHHVQVADGLITAKNILITLNLRSLLVNAKSYWENPLGRLQNSRWARLPTVCRHYDQMAFVHIVFLWWKVLKMTSWLKPILRTNILSSDVSYLKALGTKTGTWSIIPYLGLYGWKQSETGLPQLFPKPTLQSHITLSCLVEAGPNVDDTAVSFYVVLWRHRRNFWLHSKVCCSIT